MIKPQLFIYECEFFKINKPSNKLMEKMFDKIGEIQEELGIDNLDNPKILHYIAERVVLPLVEDYDMGSLTEEEFEELYNALFVHADKYVDIVHLLADRRGGMTSGEIAKITGIDGKRLAKILNNLERCDFVMRFK